MIVINLFLALGKRPLQNYGGKVNTSVHLFFHKIIHEERLVTRQVSSSSSIRLKLLIKEGGLGPDLVRIEVRAFPDLYGIPIRQVAIR